MKIAYIYYTNHDPQSAHNNQITHTCNSISNLGHDVSLITAGGIDHYVHAHNLEMLFKTCTTTTVANNPFFNQMLYYFESILRTHSYDVILTRDISFLKFLTYIPDSLVPPTVFEAHKCHTVVDGMNPAEERKRFSQADRVIAISEGIRRDLKEQGIAVHSVIRDAANVSYVPKKSKRKLRQQLNIELEASVFVYAGSLAPEKYDLETIITAFKPLADKKNNLLYILGGTESQIDSLKEHANQVGIRDAVRFAGYMPQQQVFKYLKMADVGIVAQQPTDVRASKYTSPLKLFEYLVSGLVVVGTAVPSIEEIADTEPRVLTYNEKNMDDIARVLETALSQSTNGKNKIIEEYSYQNRAESILSVLETL
jgi:glycosyltransferase involved in cell wall biosynthesis